MIVVLVVGVLVRVVVAVVVPVVVGVVTSHSRKLPAIQASIMSFMVSAT